MSRRLTFAYTAPMAIGHDSAQDGHKGCKPQPGQTDTHDSWLLFELWVVQRFCGAHGKTQPRRNRGTAVLTRRRRPPETEGPLHAGWAHFPASHASACLRLAHRARMSTLCAPKSTALCQAGRLRCPRPHSEIWGIVGNFSGLLQDAVGQPPAPRGHRLSARSGPGTKHGEARAS